MARIVHDETIIYLCDGNKFAHDDGSLERTDPHRVEFTTTANDAPPAGWYIIANANMMEPMHFCSFNCMFRRLAYDQLKLGEPIALTPGAVGLIAPIGTAGSTAANALPLPPPPMPSSYSGASSRPDMLGDLGDLSGLGVPYHPSSPLAVASSWPTSKSGGGGSGKGNGTTQSSDDGTNSVDEWFPERDTSDMPTVIKTGAQGRGVNTEDTPRSSFPGQQPPSQRAETSASASAHAAKNKG